MATVFVLNNHAVDSVPPVDALGVAVRVADCPGNRLVAVLVKVTVGNCRTVRLAILDAVGAVQVLLDNCTLYLLLFIAVVAPVMVSVCVVAPEYTPPLLMSVNVVPPSVLTCHLYVIGSVLVPVTVKLILLPEQTCLLVGWPAGAMVTGLMTVRIAAFEVAAGGQMPVMTIL